MVHTGITVIVRLEERSRLQAASSRPTNRTTQFTMNAAHPSQVVRAARLLHALADFKTYLEAEALPPDADKEGPMCSECGYACVCVGGINLGTDLYKGVALHVDDTFELPCPLALSTMPVVNQYTRLFAHARIPRLGGPDDLLVYGRCVYLLKDVCVAVVYGKCV